MKNTNEDNDEKKRYEHHTIPIEQSILQLEGAAEKMQQTVDELKPFEVNIIHRDHRGILSFINCIHTLFNALYYNFIRVCVCFEGFPRKSCGGV